MGKRPSTGGAAPKRKVSKGDVAAPVDVDQSWWPQLQTFLDNVLKEGRPADEYLSQRFPTEAARQEMALQLEEKFPAPAPLSCDYKAGETLCALANLLEQARRPQRLCCRTRLAITRAAGSSAWTKD